jgi:hypothetical protein
MDVGGACCNVALVLKFRSKAPGLSEWRSKCAAIVIGPYQTTTSHRILRLAVWDIRWEMTPLVGLVVLELR